MNNTSEFPQEGTGFLPPPQEERYYGARRLAAGVLLGLTGLSVAGAVVTSTCTLCYAVTTDGAPVAYVQGAESYQQAVARVERKVSKILQEEFRYQETPLVPAIAPRQEVQEGRDLADALMDTVEQVKPAWVLMVDGMMAGACQDQAEVEAALEAVKDRYRGEHTLRTYFDSEVDFFQDYLPLEAELLSGEDLADRLLPPEGEAVEAFAPEEGRVRLTVCTVEMETYTAEIPPEEEVVEDDTLLLGEEKVLREGRAGQEERVDRVVYRSGVEAERENLSTLSVVPAVSAQIAVGTAQGVQGAQGRFVWPCMGTVTSGFGGREIFGSSSFHRGADIAASQGSTICAAAAGTVSWAGEKGSYGNLVKVDHGNGFVTYYAHCSALLVSAGEIVDQGQAIAQVGATGRATGPHCHFEVLWQGEPVDPLQCLP